MSVLSIFSLPDSSNLLVYSIRNEIDIDPDYQRMSEVWTLEKRQLLIDSVLNGFDIPKLYFHKYVKPKRARGGNLIKYAIIDGKQRLTTIWSFIEGKFTLGDDFVLYDDKRVRASGLSYKDLSKEYPLLKTKFDARSLPIICVETDDEDLIEEMFARLNEAVPLNAAEKRNAFGGPMPKAIRNIAGHQFFEKCIPFSNKRYQYREVAAKILYLDYSLKKLKRVRDTKKAYLDKFVKDFKRMKYDKVKPLVLRVNNVLSKMSKSFTKSDRLLKTQGMVIVYFLVYRGVTAVPVSRKAFLKFEELRKENRKIAEEDITRASYALLEFDRLALQGINDAVSIDLRFSTLISFLGLYSKDPSLDFLSEIDEVRDSRSQYV